MTCIAGLAPGSATLSTAHGPVRPEQRYHGHAAEQLQAGPTNLAVSVQRISGTRKPSSNQPDSKSCSNSESHETEIANHKASVPFSNSRPEDFAQHEPRVFNVVLEKPVQGPRNGIHWAPGMHLFCQHLCHFAMQSSIRILICFKSLTGHTQM